MHNGTVSTNVFLRRIHNFALDMNWLPWSIIPKRQWPAVQFKEKRAITLDEHQSIISREKNPERKTFYELCWHLGGSQGDIASLKAEDVDWENRTVSFTRKKDRRAGDCAFGRGSVERVQRFAGRRLVVSLFVPGAGWRPGDGIRATLPSAWHSTAFRCTATVTHGRNAPKTCGYPERFAQEALGHNSMAVHRAYAKRAKMKLPSLEEYEKKAVSLPTAVNW